MRRIDVDWTWLGHIVQLYHSRLPLRAAWVCSIISLSGCGSRGGLDGSIVEHCPPGATACLSPQLGQICNQQGQWATFQCARDQLCKDSKCVATAEPCAAGVTQCLSAQVIQVCDQQGQWVSLPCVGNQSCQGSACVAAAKPCSAGTKQCLTTQAVQICDQLGQWVTLTCPDNQVCQNNACVAAANPCSVGTTQCLTSQTVQTCDEHGQWIATACKPGQSCNDGHCQANCSANAHECVTDQLQRVCLSDGSDWVSSDCPAGFECKDGQCVGICAPGSKQCAATRVTRECRSDGSGYVEQECAVGTKCEQGTCVTDVKAACSLGEDTCRDKQTALICRSDGSGLDVKTCASGTVCQTGQCMGPTCAAGQTACTTSSVANLIGVQTCSEDGTSYTFSLCRAREQCVLNKKTAHHECYLPPCNLGASMCGDPAGTYSGTDRLSRCETLQDGKVGWVSYRCSAPSACDVNDAGIARCHADCAPGDQRCTSDGNALETCGEDGKWSKQSCDQIASGVAACLVVPSNKHVVCGDPDCADLQFDLATYHTHGRCSGEKIRQCGDDGRLKAAAACDEGMCLPDSNGFGVCKDPNRCDHADGWRECSTEQDAYRTCMSSHWEFTPCSIGEQCSDDALGHAACGDECSPETRRCSGANYQICQGDGTWGPATACTTGECNPITKRCEVACQAGEIRCVGDVSLASDGTSLGSSGVQVCQTDGSWGATQSCPASAGHVQNCRRTGNGVHLGCVECVGSTVPGGNEENAVDTRCSADRTGYQTCSSNNTWPTAVTACDSSEHCIKQRDGSIQGNCSDGGCAVTSSRRCIGVQTLESPQTITDCCTGDCETATGECWHRKGQYDPTCLETTSCFSGRYDEFGNAIYETCCSGYCDTSGGGCLRIKGQACDSVTSCKVERLIRSTVCCGYCQADGSCSTGEEAEHPVGEYFACGSSSSLCWSIGSCTWTPGGSGTGAMYPSCSAESDGS